MTVENASIVREGESASRQEEGKKVGEGDAHGEVDDKGSI